jgi:hypothetical protein
VKKSAMIKKWPLKLGCLVGKASELSLVCLQTVENLSVELFEEKHMDRITLGNKRDGWLQLSFG